MTVSPCPPLGDVNNDGSVDSRDAALIEQYAVGLIPLTADQLRRADVNGDGKVDILDAALILQFEAGLIPNFRGCTPQGGGSHTWDGQTLRNGFIDITPGGIQMPSIAGQSDIDHYTDLANLAFARGHPEHTVALDAFETLELPIPCQIGTLFTVGDWGARLASAWLARGGRVLAVRVTCEGTHHVLGIPTLFKYHIYILHDQVQVILAAALLAAILAVALCQPCAHRIGQWTYQFTPPGVISGTTMPLLILLGGAGLLTLGLMMAAQRGGLEVGTYRPPELPTPVTRVGIKAGPVSTEAGFGRPGGGDRSGARRRARP